MILAVRACIALSSITSRTRQTHRTPEPSILRGCGAHTAGTGTPAVAGRLPAAHPCTQVLPPPSWAWDNEASSRVHSRSPVRSSPLPVTPGWNGSPWASPPGFTPRRYQRRMPKWGRALGHLPEITSPASTGPPQRIHSPRGPSCRTPAPPSSPIPAAAQRPDPSAALAPEHYRDLLDHLAQITDPRHRRGRRHALTVVLAVAVVAVLTGARSLAAIGEWASDSRGQVLAALGVRRDLTGAFRPPGEATVRRVLARIDTDALDRAVGAWLAAQQPPPATPATQPATRSPKARPAPTRGLSSPRSPKRSRCWNACTAPTCCSPTPSKSMDALTATANPAGARPATTRSSPATSATSAPGQRLLPDHRPHRRHPTRSHLRLAAPVPATPHPRVVHRAQSAWQGHCRDPVRARQRRHDPRVFRQLRLRLPRRSGLRGMVGQAGNPGAGPRPAPAR